MPSDPSPAPAAEESQSFVLRLRVERPYVPGTLRAAPDAPPTLPRAHIRIEHVNTGEVTQHFTIEAALDALGRRLAALVAAPAGPADPDPEDGPPPPCP